MAKSKPTKPTVKKERESTTKKKVLMIEAMTKSLGIVTNACKAVGINRATYYDWMEKDATFKAEIDLIDEVAIDFVEGKLLSKIGSGDTTAIIFYLKTKAKKRGYIEKVDIDFTDKTVSEKASFSLKKVG